MIKKNVDIIIARNLKLAGRMLKFISTFKSIGLKVSVIDISPTNNKEYASEIGIGYKSVYLKTSKFPLINFVNTLRLNFKASKKVNSSTEIILCHDLHTLLGGVFYKKRNNVKLVYDASELAVERYSGFKRYFWSSILKYSLSYCDYIIHANKQREEYFNEKHNIEKEKSIVIPNYPTNIVLAPEKQSQNNKKLIYLGTIIKNRGYEKIIELFKDLNNDFSVDFVGHANLPYKKELEKLIGDSGKIELKDPVPNNEIPKLLSNYDIGIIYYEPVNLNNYYCAPNKIYEYLQNGLCIITNSLPFFIDFLDKYRVGVYLDELNVVNIEKAIHRIYDKKMHQNITEELLNEFTWSKNEVKIKKLIDAL